MYSELVLTGLREFWPKNEDSALFLGPFCFVYNDYHSFFDYENFPVVSDPWDDNQKTIRASKYLDSLYDRLLPPLSSILNRYYNKEFSAKFWEMSTVSYLTLWLGSLYDRYLRLKMAEDSIPSTNNISVRILQNPTGLKVEELPHWFQVICSHEYNLSLFSQVIQTGSFPKFKIDSVGIDLILPEYKQPEKSPSFNRVTDSTHIQGDTYYGSVWGLSECEKEQLQRVRSHCIGKNNLDWDKIDPKYGEEDLSHFQITFTPENEFEHIVKKLLINSLPRKLLTGIPASDNDKRVKYWIGHDIYHSQDEAFQIARVVENGGRWFSTQHGGGYGFYKRYPNARSEYKASGHFLTWGWKHQHIYDCN